MNNTGGQDNRVNCSKCQRDYNSSNAFCPYCGEKSAREPGTQATAPAAQPPVPPSYVQPPPPQMMPQRLAPSSGKAVASLVLALAGLLVFPIVCSVLAIIFGRQAKREILVSEGRLRGKEMADAGFIIGIVGLALYLVLTVVIIVVAISVTPHVYNNSRANAQKRTCMANQRTVDGAVQVFYAETERYPENLQEMVESEFKVLKSIPTCPAEGAYTWVPGDPPYIKCKDPSHNLNP